MGFKITKFVGALLFIIAGAWMVFHQRAAGNEWDWGPDGFPLCQIDLIRILPREATRQIYWTGNTSSDWATGSNWSDSSVPDSNTQITIGTASNEPVVSAITDAVCMTMELNSGSLEIEGSLSLYAFEIADGRHLWQRSTGSYFSPRRC